MTRGNRIISTLVLVGLLMPGLGTAAQSQDSPPTDGSPKTFIISGTTGLAGVMLIGLPDNVVTDENGVYSAEVPQSWTGKVTPMKEGYTFEPQTRTYRPVAADYKNEDYTAAVIVFTISGDVRLADVAMKGLPEEVTTDSSGKYTAKVPYGWTGMVTPVKIGYRFEGPSRGYPPVVKNHSGQDYRPIMLTFTISGTVGISGVTMQGLPGNPVTDDKGAYETRLDYGWSGIATPMKRGYAFEPSSRRYTRIARDQQEENYAVRILTFTVSGDAGQPGVALQGLPGNPITDIDGRYSVSIEYGWHGRVKPSKPGYVFEPAERSYATVAGDLAQQDYAPKALAFTISGSTGVPGVLMQGLPGNPVSDPQGKYKAQVEYSWSGVVTPRKAGYAFSPPVREYTTVTINQNDENYAAEPGMVTISDVLTFDGEPLQNVKLTADPGGYSAVTDRDGRYTIRVPYGWSGRLLPFAEDAEDIGPFTNVTSDIIDGRPVPSSAEPPMVSSRAFPQSGVSSSMGDVLVIPTVDVTPERIAETTEDMRVMLQILREKLSEPRMILGVLRDYGSFFDQDRRAQAFHLQGTAAVFVIQADFPRSLPTQQAGAGEAQNEAVDPVWQRARQKLYSPTGSRSYAQPRQTQEMTFEQFRDELLRSLRHAANLRHVEPNEMVILTIVAQDEEAGWPGRAVSGGSYAGGFSGGSFGSGGGSGGFSGGSYGYGSSRTFSGGSAYGRSGTLVPDGRGRPGADAPGKPMAQGAVPSSATVLTMQAKKADIDAFAKGDLDFEQFRQKVKSFTY